MVDKVTFAPVATFTNDTTAVTQTNANYVLMQNAIDNTLSRDGTTPNQMGANLDMGQHRILNLSSPGGPNEPLRLADITLVPPAGAVFASPTAVVGTSTVNGVATTIMRSDAAPAIDQTMSPTWTGTHTFNNIPSVGGSAAVNLNTAQTLTNKTLTTPTIATIVNTAALTLPVGPDTIVARTSTDTLTNKTLTSPTINTPTITNPSFGASNITTTGNLSVTGTSIQTGTISAGTDVQATGYFKSGGFNRLTSNFNVTSSTALTNTNLSVTLTGGVNYLFEINLFLPGSGIQNAQIALGGTATATSYIAIPIWVDVGSNAIRGTSIIQTTFPHVIVNAFINVNADAIIKINGFIACNAGGTFVVQAAQSTSSATTFTVNAGSHMMVWQVA